MSEEEKRHAAEVRDVIRRWFPNDAKKAAAYFKDCERHRGKEQTDRLRADCRIAWADQRIRRAA